MRVIKQSAVQLNPQLLLTAAILVLLSACNGNGTPGSGFTTGNGGVSNDDFCNSPWVQAGPNCDADGTPRILPVCAGDQPGIIDACGQTITAVDLHDPVMMTMVGLTANTQHLITITNPSAVDITPGAGFIATSDVDGEINKAVIVQNMDPAAELGDYTVSVAEAATPATVVQSLTYTLEDRSRVQCVDNLDPLVAQPQASFLTSENVFAMVSVGGGTLADGDYNLYVISDIQKPLADGGLISGGATTITVAAGTGTLDLGTRAVGGYDVVVDVNGNGIFNQNTDLISRHNRLLPCFVVQGNAGGVLVEQIASDKNGNKREIFDSNANVATKTDIRDVQAYVTPTERSGTQQPLDVDTYVVAHQAVWAGGEALNDVSGGLESSPVQDFSNNEAPWFVWSYSGLAAGCYDIVVDTNQNGTFDAGTDYVDNEDHLGNNVCGFRVSDSACSANVVLNADAGGTPLTDGDSTTYTAITVSGTIAAPFDGEAYITITSGTQSNTIAVTVSAGAYSSTIPLFAGDNHITVSGVNGASSCSQTITIRSVVDLALFRAQLTWQAPGASYDMDLHLVRVSGGTGYSNGGGGADDCNYSNCNVGLAGTGSNSISWGDGTLGEEDDPKLDVDCISNCDRIENIWMSQITEDGNYQIYVDAWGGTGDNVTVTVSILGTAVGQVNCGTLVSGSPTDSCFVGTVTWVGGTSGIGSFTPNGSVAADF